MTASGNTITLRSASGRVVTVPRFDPLAPHPGDRTFRRILALSLLLHLVLLALFWNTLLGVLIEQDDTVKVRMVEEEKPEPPKPQRKVIAQTQIDTQVRKFKEFEQREIQEIKPELLDQTQLVDVSKLRNIQAPKQVEQKDLQVQRQSVFAERPAAAPRVQVDRAAPRVFSASVPKVVQRSTGPRITEAGSPRANPRAIEAQPAERVEGVVSDRTLKGAQEGDLQSLSSGTSESFLRGDGDRGTLGGENVDCNQDPACLAYLKLIRDRVYARWAIPPQIDPGKVVLSFRVDRGGAAHDIKMRHSDDSALGTTCVAAFRHASPFPPPPKEIQYIVNKGIIARFDYGR